MKKHDNLPDFSFKNAENIEYKVVWKAPRKSFNAAGLCDAPDYKTPEVWIDPRLDDKKMMDVIIEELFHAHAFDKTEKVARKFSSNLRRLLYKVGWKR